MFGLIGMPVFLYSCYSDIPLLIRRRYPEIQVSAFRNEMTVLIADPHVCPDQRPAGLYDLRHRKS